VTQAALIDANKHIVGQAATLELNLKDNDAALGTLVDFINAFMEKAPVAAAKIAGIGIGMPGFIDNDSSVMGLAELRMGAARNCKNAMVVNIGWGIGLGMIINNKLFRGDNGFAGEFSHIPLFLNDKICDCGKTGCLETETSLYVMAERAVDGVSAGKTTLLKYLSPTHKQETVNKYCLRRYRATNLL
ncbi:ROK family protein, partial [Parafilimonas sp.]|uniref:ROK family protein n=1 Tax=Parafilimonas sp. TaxID=1969739 RepID=UPI0039E4762C